MFHCILYQPEIPPNTGNVIRLCANTGVQLHLIHPLGFDLDHKNFDEPGLIITNGYVCLNMSRWQHFWTRCNHRACLPVQLGVKCVISIKNIRQGMRFYLVRKRGIATNHAG
jgi:tRNA(Leu) C34 or U34 (ribose-2'-O)-methylase TrmL